MTDFVIFTLLTVGVMAVWGGILYWLSREKQRHYCKNCGRFLLFLKSGGVSQAPARCENCGHFNYQPKPSKENRPD